MHLFEPLPPTTLYTYYLLIPPFYSLLYISSIFNQKINKNQNYITDKLKEEELAYLNIILINMLSELISSMTISISMKINTYSTFPISKSI